MMLTEETILFDRIEVLSDGTIQVREATVVLRDGVRDRSFAPNYRRYTIAPGDDTSEKDERIAAVAAAVWTPDVVKAFQGALQASQATLPQPADALPMTG